MKSTYVAASLAFLAACGGSNDPNVTSTIYDPTALFFGGASITYDATLDTYTVMRGGGTFDLPADSTFDVGTFAAGRDSSGRGSYISQTDESAAELTTFSGETRPTTVVMRRFVQTAVPDTGSATLTGDYVGILTDFTSKDVELIISGDASITFDWDQSKSSGTISNRVVRNATTNAVQPTAVADVTLVDSDTFINSGGFVGDTVGGSIDFTPELGGPTTTIQNRYSVLIAGADADEAVGRVTVIHSVVGTSDFAEELGTFALGH